MEELIDITQKIEWWEENRHPSELVHNFVTNFWKGVKPEVIDSIFIPVIAINKYYRSGLELHMYFLRPQIRHGRLILKRKKIPPCVPLDAHPHFVPDFDTLQVDKVYVASYGYNHLTSPLRYDSDLGVAWLYTAEYRGKVGGALGWELFEKK